ncbi:tyrosine-type recombinase/integrase [Candidiatus Paracoxiella cheracis]|uniref:tyrosine-type recombinase/integrase n=1 Tax=Candidiatus Paracoxiella cheracis TaxID=3405120 RepID=UPI003BF59837
MVIKYCNPIPVFDTLAEFIEFHRLIYNTENVRQPIKHWLDQCFSKATVNVPSFAINDYRIALNFLYSYRGSSQTFIAYRREIERLIQWSWFIHEKSILKLKRDDIEAFIEFCIKPYKRWIGTKTVARFVLKDGLKIPNPTWRPFEISLSKQDVKAGKTPSKDDYQFSQKALKALFAILSSFFNYCLQEEVATVNPVALIRQKSKFIRQESTAPIIRRLSNKQWQTVINLAKHNAKKDPKQERTVFILSCLYGMYLRISELTASSRWTPTMGDFFKDTDGNWWFKTVGKGNKARQIAVSPDMLKALQYYRMEYLNLPPYPTLDENTPLIGHITNPNKPMTDERTIRRLVQACFDAAAEKLSQPDPEEAQNLYSATVHWLRHTGISEDVKHRPREHVRDDAGHSSGAITDRYIDVELAARARSAKKKRLITETHDDVV